MNEQQAFERIVAESVSSVGPLAPSEGAIERTIQRVGRKRQRHEWLALIKEPPMRTTSGLAAGSPAARVAAIMIATLLLVLLTLGAGIAGTRLLAAEDAIIVAPDGSGDFTTISDAVTAAPDGDTILVRPGTYDEAVLLTKDVTIRGDGDRADIVVERSGELPSGLGKWDDPGLPYALRLEQSDAVIENLTVQGDSSRISIVGGSPTLTGLTLQGLGAFGDDAPEHDTRATWMAGMELMDGTTASLLDSEVVDTHFVVVGAASPTLEANRIGGGSLLIQGDGVAPVVRGNVFEDSWFESIWVGGGAKPEIVGNTISNEMDARFTYDSGACVYVNDTLRWPTGPSGAGTDPLVRGNSFRDCEAGVLMMRGTSATIEDNEFDGNTVGISVGEADATVAGNVIRDSRTGVEILRGESVLSDNSITQNKVGLVLDRPAKPVMSGNVICDNENNVRLMARAEMPDTEANEICADD
jgi:hypothetical protein